jgi:hypothetical protein
MATSNPVDPLTLLPVCPVCLESIEPGPTCVRDDELVVHVQCSGGALRWEPGPPQPKD